MRNQNLTYHLTPAAADIISMLRQRQYEAVERAMGHPILRPPPGPHVPTWPRMADPVAPGLRLADYSPLPADTSPPAAPPPLMARRVTTVAPYPEIGGGRGERGTRGALTRQDGATPRHVRYRAFAPGRTLAECVRHGATRRDVKWALAERLVTLEGRP